MLPLLSRQRFLSDYYCAEGRNKLPIMKHLAQNAAFYASKHNRGIAKDKILTKKGEVKKTGIIKSIIA